LGTLDSASRDKWWKGELVSAAKTPDTDDQLEMARSGDSSAAEQVLERHRLRLRRMVAARMDARLAQRIDASDVVQEALIEANRLLPVYLSARPLPFRAWLRQIAWNRLIDLHRRHIKVQKRSLTREVPLEIRISDHSAEMLSQRLVASGSSPSQRIRLEEMRDRLQAALAQLPEPMREVLLMRHLEQLSVREIAALQNVAEGTVKTRHFRGLELLRRYLEEPEA
jgi:RNA polymerase sigma-70 factor (ECF subfamily)